MEATDISLTHNSTAGKQSNQNKMWRLIVCLLSLKLVTSSNGGNDLSLNHYTPDGSVGQLAYASKAVHKSSPRIAFHDVDLDAIVFMSVVGTQSPLSRSLRNTIEIFHEPEVVFMPTGYSADGDYLLEQINLIIQRHCQTYGEPPNLDSISAQMSRWVTRGLYRDKEDKQPISRPLASTVAIAAFDRQNKRNRLLQVDNTGLITERRVSITGAISNNARDKLLSVLLSTSNLTGTPLEQNQKDQPILSTNEENLLRKCHQCLGFLVRTDNTDINEDEDEGREKLIECCILDASGGISHATSIIRESDFDASTTDNAAAVTAILEERDDTSVGSRDGSSGGVLVSRTLRSVKETIDWIRHIISEV